MSPSAPAVFLSYASQDAAVVQRLAEALRAAGIEVWFDQSELRGGDAWDAKIKQQIRGCALFVPIISAHTEARPEGYFRLEWKLAVDRSHLMSDDHPFLFPVVIDDTPDAHARVPDRFRERQWMRLGDRESPADIAARIQTLLQTDRISLPEPPEPAEASPSPAAPRPSRRKATTIAGMAIGLTVFAFFVLRPIWWSQLQTLESTAAESNASPAATPADYHGPVPWSGFLSDPRLRQAFELVNGLESNPVDFRLAEDIVEAVLAEDALDPEAVITMARVQISFLYRSFDRSDERLAEARRWAERAERLAPDNPQAIVTLGVFQLSGLRDLPLAENTLARALALNPNDSFTRRFYDESRWRQPDFQIDEMIAIVNAAADRFPDDPLNPYMLARLMRSLGRPDEMEAALNRTIAIFPLTNAILYKARNALVMHGDLDEMAAQIERVPDRMRNTERVVVTRFQHALFSGNYDEGLIALRRFTAPWIEDNDYTGPTALLEAMLLDLAGKPDLAQRQADLAAQVLAERHDANLVKRMGLDPTIETWIPLLRGRIDEAKENLRIALQATGRPYRMFLMAPPWDSVFAACLILGERDTALTLLREALASPDPALSPDWVVETSDSRTLLMRHSLRTWLDLDPRMAPWRDDPEICALLTEPAGDTKPTASTSSPNLRDWPTNPDLKRAVALLDSYEAIPEDFRLAEEIVQQQLDRKPMDPETLTAMARVQSMWLLRGWDRTDERYRKAKSVCERARQLAPDNPEALAALAIYTYVRDSLTRGQQLERANDLIEEAIALAPEEPRFHRLRDSILFYLPGVTREQAFASAEATVARFPEDALVHYELARRYRDAGRWEETQRELDAAIALGPVANAIVWKSRVEFGLNGDLQAMKRLLDSVPPRMQAVERTVFGNFIYATMSGDYAEGMSAVQLMPETWMVDFDYSGPRTLLLAELLRLQGKQGLANRQYSDALSEIKRRQAETAFDLFLQLNEAWTLIGLGRLEEARKINRLCLEALPRPFRFYPVSSWWFSAIPLNLLLGERATALELIKEASTDPEGRRAIAQRMRQDPRMQPYVEDPDIQALLDPEVTP